MSDDDLSSLPPGLRALIEKGRARAEPPAAVRERLRERLEATLQTPLHAASLGLPGGKSAGVLRLVPRGLVRSMTIFLLGGAAGAGIHAASQKAPEPPVAVVSQAPAPSPEPAPEPARPPEAEPARRAAGGSASAPLTRPTPRPPPPAPAAEPREERDTELARERALLELARTALGRGQSAAALEAAEKHERGFPQGQLGEEREVIRVQALITAGRLDEARARAARFRREFPESMLLHAVDSAVDSGTP
ncbi:MAG: hypothetical protein ACYC8T_32900 [Myxococcaceae bacterium]